MKEPKLLKKWLEKARAPRGSKSPGKPFRGKKFSELTAEDVSGYDRWVRIGVFILSVYILSEITSQIIRVFIPPVAMDVPQTRASKAASRSKKPVEEFDVILSRNVFNVEGTIPDPLDQGRQDCFSQAKASAQRLSLLGTIVMNDEQFSVALIEESGNPVRLAVKKDDLFFDAKYQAMKVERKRFCFQVKATQDFEYVEIPDDSGRLGLSGTSLVSGAGGVDGIVQKAEGEYTVKRDFLEKQLLNLTDILQTARAVPYIDPQTGRFRGFLVQSMDPNSPFRQLGVNTGDVVTAVGDIVLDNAGKGLEAFQRLRNSAQVNLRVLRGGQEQSLNYDIK